MKTISLNNHINILPSSENPLSADVIFVTLPDKTIIFDVGSNSEALEMINKINTPKTFVLSHFHQDHTENLNKLIPLLTPVDNIYAGDFTCKKYPQCINVTTPVCLCENPHIIIYPIPSSHAKGSLILQVNDIIFTGDSTYRGTKNGIGVYNVSLLNQTIKILESTSASYLYLSHNNFLQNKNEIIAELKTIYSKRTPGETYIFPTQNK